MPINRFYNDVLDTIATRTFFTKKKSKLGHPWAESFDRQGCPQGGGEENAKYRVLAMIAHIIGQTRTCTPHPTA